jgi:POT family proton-dependent oligopeptide transporter
MLNNKLIAISLSEISERIIYYGLQAALVLYLMNNYLMPVNKSYDIYCLYTALTFLFSVFGGFIADKYLGCFYTTLLGSFVISIGNSILCAHNVMMLYLGLSMVAVGVGLFKPNNSSLYGLICDLQNTNKSKAFSIFYLFTTTGSLIGPLLYGSLIKTDKHWVMFVLSSFCVFIINSYLYLKIKNDTFILKFFDLLKSILLIILLVISSVFLMHYLQSSQKIFLSSILAIFIIITNGIIKMEPNDKKSIVSIFMPMVSCVIYFMFFLQIYSSLTVYLDRFFDRHVLGYEIPAAWFSILEPIFVLLAIPFLNYLYERVNWNETESTNTLKITFGLALAAVSFLVFSLLTLNIFNQYGNYILIIVANFILAMGEACVIPLTVSLVTTVSPKKYKNTIMGIFYFAFSISSFSAGFIAKLSTNKGFPTSSTFTNLFFLIALILFLSAAINQIVTRTFVRKIVLD